MNETTRPGTMKHISETPVELNEEIMRATVAETGVCGEFSLRPTDVSMFANLLEEV